MSMHGWYVREDEVLYAVRYEYLPLLGMGFRAEYRWAGPAEYGPAA